MKASEVIKEIQKLVDKHGDKEFNVYLSFDKKTQTPSEVVYDEGEDDIYVGVYG